MTDVAYFVGRYLVVPVAGAALLALGQLAKRRSADDRVKVIARAEAENQYIDDLALPRAAGAKRIVVGAVLLGLATVSIVSGAVQAIREHSDVESVRVFLPATLLGMQRHDAYFYDRSNALLASIPDEVPQADAAYYGSPYGGLYVVATRGDTRDPEGVAKGFFAGAALKGTLTGVEDRDGVTPRGVGRCGVLKLNADQATPRQVCVWVDSRSAVFTLDSLASSLEDGASRSQQVVSLVLRAASGAPSVLREPVIEHPAHVTLPPALLGARRDTKHLAKERAEFMRKAQAYTTQADLGLYVGSGHVLLVKTQATDLTPHTAFLTQYAAMLASESGHGLGTRVKVAPGGLGGEGDCWHVQFEHLAAVACVLLDDAAYVAVVDYNVTDIPTAARHARAIRRVVEKR